MTQVLTIEQLRQAQEQIISGLKAKEKDLAQIQAVSYPLIIKWQMLLGVLLPIQIETAKKFGFTNEQTALIEFNKQLIDQQQNDPQLQSLNEQKWHTIFKQAFNMDSVQKITLEQARNLVAEISTEMMSEHFLKQVDQTMGQIDPKADLMQKRQTLITVLLPMQMAVMAKHGFEGEQGYVQAQRALMDYLHDPQIMEKAAKSQIALFTRAKVMD